MGASWKLRTNYISRTSCMLLGKSEKAWETRRYSIKKSIIPLEIYMKALPSLPLLISTVNARWWCRFIAFQNTTPSKKLFKNGQNKVSDFLGITDRSNSFTDQKVETSSSSKISKFH